jgi:magnesium-transporting ATPase (P-type)
MDFHSIDTCLPKDENSQYERKVALIQLGMAVCHTLSLSESDELLGNHVDKAAFASLTSSLRKGDLEKLQVVHNEKIYTILRKFDFDTHRATQSVVVQDDAGDKLIFVKGSPEAIEKLSEPSTVPKLFQEKVRSAAKSGMYQIAMAYKVFDFNFSVGEVLREEIEKSLVFCGLIGFQNKMKVETPEVLSEIENGSVSLTMVTGDSVLTGVFIARQAGIIKPNRQLILGNLNLDGGLDWIDADTEKLIEKPMIIDEHKNEVDIALTGDTWEALLESDNKYALMIAEHIRVFGRCNPVHKVSIISTFIEKGYVTLMCGDGQNDCGALKSAHVGIALSTAEASLVAPFTSIDKDIKAVVELLREGRCALASAFAAYKYYILYGQIEAFLQTMTAYLSVTFSEWCWIFLDGIWSTTMVFSLPLANAAKRLSPVRPTASLFSLHTLSSACGLLAINFLFQIIALLALFGQDWFQCRKWNGEDVSNVLTIGDNYETTALFVVGGFQYYATAMSLNFGYTFRENWWKNYIFVALAALWTSMQFVMTIHPSKFSCIWRVNCNNEVRILPLSTSTKNMTNVAFRVEDGDASAF